MAVADNAGVESLGIGISANMGIGVGHSLPVPRTYSLPSVDASDSSTKQMFDTSRLEQQPQHQQLQMLQHQQLQQQTPDAVQQIQQSKHTRSGPRPPKQQLPPQQQHTPSRSNGVVSRDPEAVGGVAAVDSRSIVSNDSMRELEDLLTKLNPLAKEFVPPSHIETGSLVLSSSSSKGNMRRVRTLVVTLALYAVSMIRIVGVTCFGTF